MNEKERIISLFNKLYNGEPWIGVNIKSTLNKLSAEQASKRVLSNCNTIWEIVNHIISWRLAVKERIKGNNISAPDNNYFEPIQNKSDEAWEGTLQRFELSQIEWVNFLNSFNESNLDTEYMPGEMTYYELIHGIIQHDSYHLGQIVILAKQATLNNLR